MTYGDICEAVDRLKRQYKESDPVRLCKMMDILLLYNDFGPGDDAVKGFFLVTHRIRSITINSRLPSVIQRIIMAHELGHAVLHSKTGIHTFREVGLFDESSALEKDANLFAAEYLLDDDEVLETLNEDKTFFSAAAALYVPIELLDFKFRVMKWKGYKMVEPPITARNNFLRDMEVPKNADYYSC